jgi:phosphatidylserine/phosphatidylglycerophosphate/cardiolipin synthase-like enzyme
VKPAIAHNKVMVIDRATVITGSFNFTAATQKSNAENPMLIEDPMPAGKYRANWEARQKASKVYTGALPATTEPTE